MSGEGQARGVIETALLQTECRSSGGPGSTLTLPSVTVPIVASSWHTQIMDELIAGAHRAARSAAQYGLHVHAPVIRVPGSMELSVACAALARAGRDAPVAADALVALGVVIKGDTPHFDYVCSSLTYGLTKLSVERALPIGFGVLTCDDEAQARARSGGPDAQDDKGAEAMEAAIATLLTVRTIVG